MGCVRHLDYCVLTDHSTESIACIFRFKEPEDLIVQHHNHHEKPPPSPHISRENTVVLFLLLIRGFLLSVEVFC